MDRTLIVKNLECGEYKIVETGELDGYKLEETEYEFIIGRYNQEVKLSVDLETIKNYKNTFCIQKIDEENQGH